VVTLDLHASQIQGFFRIPWTTLRKALSLRRDRAVQACGIPGRLTRCRLRKRARRFAQRLGAPSHRRQIRRGHGETAELVGHRESLIATRCLDDFTISGVRSWSRRSSLRAVHVPYGCVTHGVFAQGSMDRLDAARSSA